MVGHHLEHFQIDPFMRCNLFFFNLWSTNTTNLIVLKAWTYYHACLSTSYRIARNLRGIKNLYSRLMMQQQDFAILISEDLPLLLYLPTKILRVTFPRLGAHLRKSYSPRNFLAIL